MKRGEAKTKKADAIKIYAHALMFLRTASINLALALTIMGLASIKLALAFIVFVLATDNLQEFNEMRVKVGYIIPPD
jgi:hypothetical protein